MKNKHITAHMKSAFNYAECSTAERLKVGCVIVKDDRIISIGYNGMPSGWTNVCEDENFITKVEVLHAEENAITKLARSNESGEGAAAFITHVPCLSCAKLLYSSGIIEVWYAHPYRNTEGLDFLAQCNIKVNACNTDDTVQGRSYALFGGNPEFVPAYWSSCYDSGRIAEHIRKG